MSLRLGIAALWAATVFASASTADDPVELTLFNGKDLTGWKVVHGGTYYVKDGNLVLENGNGWLRTDGEFADFDLTIEWRADPKYRDVPKKDLPKKGYDSGLFFRSGLDGSPWPKGKYQFNIKQADGGNLPGISNTGAVHALKPTGEWNTYRLVCKGTHAEGYVNGVEAWKTDKIKTAKGYIGLQAEGHHIEFRNLRLKVLSN